MNTVRIEINVDELFWKPGNNGLLTRAAAYVFGGKSIRVEAERGEETPLCTLYIDQLLCKKGFAVRDENLALLERGAFLLGDLAFQVYLYQEHERFEKRLMWNRYFNCIPGFCDYLTISRTYYLWDAERWSYNVKVVNEGFVEP